MEESWIDWQMTTVDTLDVDDNKKPIDIAVTRWYLELVNSNWNWNQVMGESGVDSQG